MHYNACGNAAKRKLIGRSDAARETFKLLHETLPGRVLTRFGYQNWSQDHLI